MRILVQALVAAPGGSLTVLRDLVAAWPAEDELLIVCWRREAAEALGATGHRVVRVEAGSTEGALLRLRRRPPSGLVGFRPDVVWSQAVWAGGYDAPQAIHYRDIGSFVDIHPDSWRQRAKSRRERYDLRRANLRIFNSATMRDAVWTRHPRAHDLPHAVIYNGLDLNAFFSAAGLVRSPNGPRRVLLPQSDAPHKRNEVAAEVLAQLRDLYPTLGAVELTIAGTGQYLELRSSLARHGLSKRVRFVGYVGREEMARLYATHDAVLMTGRAESFGNPIIEAHATGTPVVTPPFAVAREIAGPLSLVAERDDAVALSRSLHDGLRMASGSVSRDSAKAHAGRFTSRNAAQTIRSNLKWMAPARQTRSRRQSNSSQ